MPLKINLNELFKESNLIIATLTIFNLTPGKWIYLYIQVRKQRSIYVFVICILEIRKIHFIFN